MKKLQILMSTYNGEKYLEQQLDSIVNLDGFSHISVLIRDDGSTDKTLKILIDYKNKYGFDVLCGENIGVNKSYFELLNGADSSAEYFAFCDQDDLWLYNKISSALAILDSKNSHKPLLYAARSELADEDLINIGYTPLPKKQPSFYNAVVENIFPGHTMIINNPLMQKLKSSDFTHIFMYDWWTYLLATAFGSVIYDENVTVKYRQHKNNVLGYELNWFKHFITRMKKLVKGDTNAVFAQAHSFYLQYENELNHDFKTNLYNFLQLSKNFGERFKYIFSTPFFRQKNIETIQLKLLFLIGKYKQK